MDATLRKRATTTNSLYSDNNTAAKSHLSPAPKHFNSFKFSSPPGTPGKSMVFSSSSSVNPRFKGKNGSLRKTKSKKVGGSVGKNKGSRASKALNKKYILDGEVPAEELEKMEKNQRKTNIFSTGLTLKRVKSIRSSRKLNVKEPERKSSNVSESTNDDKKLKKQRSLPKSMRTLRSTYLSKLNKKADSKLNDNRKKFEEQETKKTTVNKLQRYSTFHKKLETVNNFYSGQAAEKPQRRPSSFTADCPKILLLGPENSGKTQMLKHMQSLSEDSASFPSSHLYARQYSPTMHPVEMDLRISGQDFVIVDLPGSEDKIVDWRAYLNSNHPGAAFDLVFFVVDASTFEKEKRKQTDLLDFFEGIVNGFNVRSGSCKVVLLLNKIDKLKTSVSEIEIQVSDMFTERMGETEFFIECSDAQNDFEGTQDMLKFYVEQVKGYQKGVKVFARTF
eukprot:maker-scaffold_2-snap-gene-21.57-mRNA-1 protein AED:0.05 eAED:0.87 QI:0/0/0.5/1/0/0/2/186/447